MKRKLFIFRLAAIMATVMLGACGLFEGGETPEPEEEYLVSYSNVNAATVPIIKPVFTALEGQFPNLFGISEKVKYGVTVYRVSYNTTFMGNQVLASGLVSVPMGTGTFPLLSFQNGTNTLNSKAPSVNPNDQLFSVIEMIASMGFVVAIPDYLGFGASSGLFHPYLHKESTITTVTDLHRAAAELLKKLGKSSMTKETYLMGYSQGGWATMALKKEMETSLTGEYTLKASSCGAGPYDLTAVSSHILTQQSYPMPYFLAYMVNSYIKTNEMTLTPGDIFNAPYSGEDYIAMLFDGSHDAEYINSKLSPTVSTLFKKEFLDNVATGEKYAGFRTALSRNSVEAWKTTTPTLIIHGIADTFVPVSASTDLIADFNEAQAPTDLITVSILPGLDHQDAIMPWGVASLKWLLDKRDN